MDDPRISSNSYQVRESAYDPVVMGSRYDHSIYDSYRGRDEAPIAYA